MTRIVAGSARGRRLATPAGAGTRPTADRVREAVFSALESTLGSWTGVRFLDLFAGSGAVGLEAVSRGAAHATLVEQHRRTAGVARRNAATLGFSQVDVVVARAETFLRRAGDEQGGRDARDGSYDRYDRYDCYDCYDVVFLDPPYALDGAAVTEVLAAVVEHGWPCPDAVVVVERPTRGPDVVWPDGVRGDRVKRYGETAVWYGRAGCPRA